MRMTYLFDPLCGWCYGASPVISRLSELDGVRLELSPSGLFAGQAARRMDSDFADFAWQNDQRIARLTNQPFTAAYRAKVLGAQGTMFDSAPTTLAIVAAGLTETGNQELAVLKTLQKARYEDGRNTSDLQTVASIMKEEGFVATAARLAAPDEALLSQYRERISTARSEMSRFGVQGVPALVVGDGHDRHLVRTNALFGNFDLLKAQLAA